MGKARIWRFVYLLLKAGNGDVYKRQYQQLRRLPHSFPHIKDSPAKTPTFQTTDVYKRQINGYASEAVLVRFLYHRELELRNSARYTYMWLSQGDPFRFFDEDIGMKLRQWDMMELHAILEHRKKVGRDD